ncbi:MAG: nucleotidyltransferase domain-containing protein [Candidatus Omnitrophota bacterium]|nr:nucleotidyltransferase domain-containing protein [Candidatus Omnitrophota bacterium]
MVKFRDSVNLKIDPVIKQFLDGLERLGLKQKIEKVYLFGSRAKGIERPDSDYDLLIVSSLPDKEFKSKIYDIAVDILLETGRDVSLKIFKTEEFNRLCRMRTPFTQNVLKEGIRIG